MSMFIKNIKLDRETTNVELTDDEIKAIVACVHMAAREGMYEFTELNGISNTETILISAMKKLGIKDDDIDNLLKGI